MKEPAIVSRAQGPRDVPDNTPTPDRATGRGKSDAEKTMQVSLRLPTSWMAQLRRRALMAGAKEDLIITPQEIIRRLIEADLKNNG